MKSCNSFLLIIILIIPRQHDCVASTQRCDVDVLSFAVPTEPHAKAVFSKLRCSCHLPPQVLRCVIHIHIDDVRLTIKSLDVEFHCCFLCFLLWEWWKTQSLIVHLSLRSNCLIRNAGRQQTTLAVDLRGRNELYASPKSEGVDGRQVIRCGFVFK